MLNRNSVTLTGFESLISFRKWKSTAEHTHIVKRVRNWTHDDYSVYSEAESCISHFGAYTCLCDQGRIYPEQKQ